MTITTTAAVVNYAGNGATTNFPYAFKIPAAANVSVFLTNLASGAVTPLVNGTHYTITGLGTPGGGAVTYPLVGAALAAGNRLTIQRVIPLTQTDVIPSQGAFYASTTEAILDRVVMMMQALDELYDRTLRAPLSDAVLNDMPNSSLRANMALLFDANGQPVVGAVAGTAISGAMVPVVQAATLDAAVVALFTGLTRIGYARRLTATLNFDFGSVADNATGQQTVAVPGAVTEDFCLPPTSDGAAQTTNGIFLFAKVTAADTVTVYLHNDSGGAFDAALQNYRVCVIKKTDLGF